MIDTLLRASASPVVAAPKLVLSRPGGLARFRPEGELAFIYDCLASTALREYGKTSTASSSDLSDISFAKMERNTADTTTSSPNTGRNDVSMRRLTPGSPPRSPHSQPGPSQAASAMPAEIRTSPDRAKFRAMLLRSMSAVKMSGL